MTINTATIYQLLLEFGMVLSFQLSIKYVDGNGLSCWSKIPCWSETICKILLNCHQDFVASTTYLLLPIGSNSIGLTIPKLNCASKNNYDPVCVMSPKDANPIDCLLHGPTPLFCLRHCRQISFCFLKEKIISKSH